MTSVTPGNGLPPTQLVVVQELLNSRPAANGSDELETTESMRRWLVRHRLAGPQVEFREGDRRHLVEVREALASLVAANGSDGVPRRPVTVLNEAARRVRLGVRLHPEDGYRLMAEGVGVDRPVGELLVRVMSAMAAGSWSRLKVCANPACARAYYDTSRNRSARWCSMAVCGNRMKGRAYRQRRAAAPALGARHEGSSAAMAAAS